MTTGSLPAPSDLEVALTRARQFISEGRNEEAYASYLEVLGHDPAHPAALHELGCLAHADGYRSAARTIYAQIVGHRPRDLIGRLNLGNILYEDGDLAAARGHFEAALDIDPGSADAHRGMGRILSDQGDADAADRHWRRSFSGQAVTPLPYRAKEPAVRILLLVSTKGGNIPTRNILDDRIFAVTVLYAEYYRPDLPLPPHALLFNAIGDADLCFAALAAAEQIAARTVAPIVNRPEQVGLTGRAANAKRLGNLAGVRAPVIVPFGRETLSDISEMTTPLLLRARGFHTGQHFVRVDRPEDLKNAVAELPGETLLAIEYLDARGVDGMRRKYRVMCIDGSLYPMHLAVSADWKVHYFTADMAASPEHRAEEQLFLESMPSVLGAPAMAALTRICAALGLDYAGIDFAIGGDGSILLFEANATMIIHPPAPEPLWDYRRAPTELALRAAKDMLLARAAN